MAAAYGYLDGAGRQAVHLYLRAHLHFASHYGLPDMVAQGKEEEEKTATVKKNGGTRSRIKQLL